METVGAALMPLNNVAETKVGLRNWIRYRHVGIPA
jgi:hypothetical protein